MLYEVRRSDIDINRHMHNLNYLKLAYENLPEEVFFCDELKNVKIMYKHQILLGQKVKCYYSNENEKCIITLKSEDDRVLHSIFGQFSCLILCGLQNYSISSRSKKLYF